MLAFLWLLHLDWTCNCDDDWAGLNWGGCPDWLCHSSDAGLALLLMELLVALLWPL